MTTSFTFNLGLDGKISYSPAFNRHGSGSGTSTLTLRGYPVCVDARATGATGANAMREPGAFLGWGGSVQLY